MLLLEPLTTPVCLQAKETKPGAQPAEQFPKETVCACLKFVSLGTLGSQAHWIEGRCHSLRWQEESDHQPGQKEENHPSGELYETDSRHQLQFLCLSPSMDCLKKKTLSFLLIFVSIYARGTLLQEAGPARQRKPFFERLRRLEEQVGETHLGSWMYKASSR